MNQRGVIFPLALVTGKAVANAIIPLQAEPDDVRASEGHRSLRNEAAPKWNLSHQCPRDGSKAERSGHDRSHLRLLRPVANLSIAGRGNQKAHADLVHGEERRVAGEFAD